MTEWLLTGIGLFLTIYIALGWLMKKTKSKRLQ